MADQYPTPSEAATSSFPDGAAKVLFESVDGAYAVILLETGSPTHPYPYEVLCCSPGSSWREMSSSNGPGRHELPDGRSVLTIWDFVGSETENVRVVFHGRIYDVPVSGGYYFIAMWDPTDSDNDDGDDVPHLVS